MRKENAIHSTMFGSGFSTSKIKPQLKMASTRIALVVNKKTTINKSLKKEIAKLLAEGKEEKASIKVCNSARSRGCPIMHGGRACVCGSGKRVAVTP